MHVAQAWFIERLILRQDCIIRFQRPLSSTRMFLLLLSAQFFPYFIDNCSMGRPIIVVEQICPED